MASLGRITTIDHGSKSVEFSGFDDDAEEGEQLNGHASEEHRPITDKANGQQLRSLEFLLATKNKRISEELTKIRVSVSSRALPTCRLMSLFCLRYCMENWKLRCSPLRRN